MIAHIIKMITHIKFVVCLLFDIHVLFYLCSRVGFLLTVLFYFSSEEGIALLPQTMLRQAVRAPDDGVRLQCGVSGEFQEKRGRNFI